MHSRQTAGETPTLPEASAQFLLQKLLELKEIKELKTNVVPLQNERPSSLSLSPIYKFFIITLIPSPFIYIINYPQFNK